MSRTDEPGKPVKALAGERRRVLEVLRGEALTGPAILRRMSEPSTAADAGAAGGAEPGGAEPADASLLYPALHSLEADWRLEAAWLPEAGGVRRRTYRKRRLVPHLPGGYGRS